MMIDKQHQRTGAGAQAMRLFINRVINGPNPSMILLSHLKGNTAAARFYQGLGFTYTGKEFGGNDLEMSLRFDEHTRSSLHPI